jgi:hypothetical protein
MRLLVIFAASGDSPDASNMGKVIKIPPPATALIAPATNPAIPKSK